MMEKASIGIRPARMGSGGRFSVKTILPGAVCLGLFLGGALSGCQTATGAPATPAHYLGVSPSMEELAQGLTGAYHLAYPSEPVFQIAVISEKDLQTELKQNQVSAVMDWNEPDPEDWSAEIGWTGIVLAVNLQNGVRDLSRDQAKKIFLGLIDRWESVGGTPGDVHPLTYETGQEIGNLFQGMVLNQGQIAGNGLVVPTPYAMIQEIQKDPSSIGYVLGFNPTGVVRPLTIDQTAAGYANLLSAKYPFRAPIFVVCGKPALPEIERFAGWAQSADGQLAFLRMESWE